MNFILRNKNGKYQIFTGPNPMKIEKALFEEEFETSEEAMKFGAEKGIITTRIRG